jgi:opine dehydrogenase
MIGAFPGKNAEKAAEAYGTMYYGTRTMKPIPNALEGLLLDYNAITHPPPMICNAGRVGTGDRSFHIFGKDSAIEPVCRMMEKLDLERIAIGKALGFSESSPACTTIPMLLKGWLIIDKELTYYNAIHTWFLEICEGPFSLKTRYLIEDIPMGLRLWSSLGDMLDVPTPVSDAIITVVSILLDEDYWKTGRVVETLGIDPSWTLEQLNRFMEEGEI